MLFSRTATFDALLCFNVKQVRRRSNMNSDKAVIECDYSIAPFATSERKKQVSCSRISVVVDVDSYESYHYRGHLINGP